MRVVSPLLSVDVFNLIIIQLSSDKTEGALVYLELRSILEIMITMTDYTMNVYYPATLHTGEAHPRIRTINKNVCLCSLMILFPPYAPFPARGESYAAVLLNVRACLIGSASLGPSQRLFQLCSLSHQPASTSKRLLLHYIAPHQAQYPSHLSPSVNPMEVARKVVQLGNIPPGSNALSQSGYTLISLTSSPFSYL